MNALLILKNSGKTRVSVNTWTTLTTLFLLWAAMVVLPLRIRKCRIRWEKTRYIYGLPGGEAFECRYARVEEGYGRTIHCRTCTVRNLVYKTCQTGEFFYQVPAHVDGDEGRLEFLISIVKLDLFVQLAVEPVPVQESGSEKESPD
jgi:hypothetical protein